VNKGYAGGKPVAATGHSFFGDQLRGDGTDGQHASLAKFAVDQPGVCGTAANQSATALVGSGSCLGQTTAGSDGGQCRSAPTKRTVGRPWPVAAATARLVAALGGPDGLCGQVGPSCLRWFSAITTITAVRLVPWIMLNSSPALTSSTTQKPSSSAGAIGLDNYGLCRSACDVWAAAYQQQPRAFSRELAATILIATTPPVRRPPHQFQVSLSFGQSDSS